MSNHLQSELTADLLRDLSAPAAEPVPARVRGASPGRPRRPHGPAVSFVFTPLHWMRPSIGRLDAGSGVCAVGGPWRVDVTV